MPRLRIPDHPNALWHITQRVNWQAWHLHAAWAYAILCRAVEEARQAFDMELVAFVAMSNHFHSVVRSANHERFRIHTTNPTKCRHRRPVPAGHPRSGVVGQYVRRYSLAVSHTLQKKLNVSGHFWEGRHDRVLIRSPRQLAATIAYDHRNPVTAGIVSRAEDYGRSSAGFWAGVGNSDLPLLTRGEPFLECDPTALRQLVLAFQNCDRIDFAMRQHQESGVRRGTPEELESLDRLLDEAGLPSIPRSR